jgi:hypothetical protein
MSAHRRPQREGRGTNGSTGSGSRGSQSSRFEPAFDDTDTAPGSSGLGLSANDVIELTNPPKGRDLWLRHDRLCGLATNILCHPGLLPGSSFRP